MDKHRVHRMHVLTLAANNSVAYEGRMTIAMPQNLSLLVEMIRQPTCRVCGGVAVDNKVNGPVLLSTRPG